MLRGINQQQIFEDEEDYQKFIEIVKAYQAISEYKVFAYCLMVGLEHTRSVKKYLLRLLIVAVISQPLFTWSFFTEEYWKKIKP